MSDDEDTVVWTTLYDDTGNNETNDRGEFAFKDLYPGTYRLTETGSAGGNSLQTSGGLGPRWYPILGGCVGLLGGGNDARNGCDRRGTTLPSIIHFN